MAKKVRVIETEFLDQLLECRGNDVAQPVLVIDTRSRTVSVDTRFSGDARTFAEENGDVILFDIPLLQGETADKLMYEVAPLARIVCDADSDSVEFEEAMSAIASIIDGYDADLEFWFAEDWFDGHSDAQLAAAMGVTPETTDDEIGDLARLEEATAGGPIIECVEYLENLRNGLKAAE